MSKLNTRPSPNPKEKEISVDDNGYEAPKRKRNFEVVDAQALYALYPQFFKLVPDYAKIRQAIKLGLAMPGVVFDGSEISEETEAQNYQGE